MVDSSNADIQRKAFVSSLFLWTKYIKRILFFFRIKPADIWFFFMIEIIQYKKLTRDKINIAPAPWINSVEYIRRNGRMFSSLYEHQHENSPQDIDLALNLEENLPNCSILILGCIFLLRMYIIPTNSCISY